MLKLLTAGAVLMGTAALAQNSGASSTAPASQRGPGGNPDEVVCISESAVGSRLGRRRVCRTRAEWAHHQGDSRQQVERAQQQMQSQNIDADVLRGFSPPQN